MQKNVCFPHESPNNVHVHAGFRDGSWNFARVLWAAVDSETKGVFFFVARNSEFLKAQICPKTSRLHIWQKKRHTHCSSKGWGVIEHVCKNSESISRKAAWTSNSWLLMGFSLNQPVCCTRFRKQLQLVLYSLSIGVISGPFERNYCRTYIYEKVEHCSDIFRLNDRIFFSRMMSITSLNKHRI